MTVRAWQTWPVASKRLQHRQTMDGFFAGESVPVNEKLAKIILQLHISEQTGRGVPAIVDAYGRETFRFTENNIKVTIPFEKLSGDENAQVRTPDVQVNAQVVGAEEISAAERLLSFCEEPKSLLEIAD